MTETIQETFLEDEKQVEAMGRVLVTTTYSADSIILAITKLSVDRVYLLVDKKPNDIQSQTIE